MLDTGNHRSDDRHEHGHENRRCVRARPHNNSSTCMTTAAHNHETTHSANFCCDVGQHLQAHDGDLERHFVDFGQHRHDAPAGVGFMARGECESLCVTRRGRQQRNSSGEHKEARVTTPSRPHPFGPRRRRTYPDAMPHHSFNRTTQLLRLGTFGG